MRRSESGFALAEADQERLRGIRNVAISGDQNTSTVDASGITCRKAEWIRDATS